MPTFPRRVYQNGILIESGVVDYPQELANADSMRAKALAALTANNTYLAIANPTAAQNTTQIQRLTRECNALIRFALDRFDVDDA